MDAVRHFALGCCLLFAVGGVVRLFWPENGFKPVINTALVLYIVASALPMARQTDWAALGRDLRGWAGAELTAAPRDYSAYAAALGGQTAAAALEKRLEQDGIAAQVTVDGELCRVQLQETDDLAVARVIVAAARGALPYEITVIGGGDAP